MIQPPPPGIALQKVQQLDVADPATGERRTSDAWFASEEMKQLLQALAKNWGCDYTQLLPPFLTAANGCATRMKVKMQSTDHGYPNTQAVGIVFAFNIALIHHSLLVCPTEFRCTAVRDGKVRCDGLCGAWAADAQADRASKAMSKDCFRGDQSRWCAQRNAGHEP